MMDSPFLSIGFFFRRFSPSRTLHHLQKPPCGAIPFFITSQLAIWGNHLDINERIRAMLGRRISGRSLIKIAFLALLLFLGSGCGLYLHNPEKATIAKETLEEFNNFKKGTNIYEAMLENLQTVQGKTAELQAEALKQFEIAFKINSTRRR